MVKMKDRNAQLKSTLVGIAPKERVAEIQNIPAEDTVNLQGHVAYSLSDQFKLVTMLNTLKVQPQFYRSENQQLRDLQTLIEKVAMNDPYFVAQAIVWSRCLGEGMRTINHLAAALLSPFISGNEYAKRFYGPFNKKTKSGGCIFRLDDMTEIKNAYDALSAGVLSNAMRKGFASVLENADTYQLAKYSKTAIDIANLSHPNSKNSKATIEVEGKEMKTLDALMQGITVQADSWEVAQSSAGQEVAAAVREGKLTKEEAKEVLSEAKADNWESLLSEGKLGVLAALRNIRNILKVPRKSTIDAWCKLITDSEKIRKALILPIHFDLANTVVSEEMKHSEFAGQVKDALERGYLASIPNLQKIFTGRTAVIVDQSGSMGWGGICLEGSNNGLRGSSSQPCKKAGLIAATLAKSVGADVYGFGGTANKIMYNKSENIYTLASRFGKSDQGYTNPAAAFELLTKNREIYDRIIFISDNEINGRVTSTAYREYLRLCSPYIYAVDLAAYGTTPLKNEGKISYLFGYGPTLYEAIANNEFSAEAHMDEIRKIVI